MESQRNDNAFLPVDPFRPSISFSVKNLWQGRSGAANEQAGDIYSRPVRVAPPVITPFHPLPTTIRFPRANMNKNSSTAAVQPASLPAESAEEDTANTEPPEDGRSFSFSRDSVSFPTHSNLLKSISARNEELIEQSTATDPPLIIIEESAVTDLPLIIEDKPMPTVPPLNVESYSALTLVLAFILDSIPRQIYLYLLLRLPYMYFSRVTRIFEEAEMSMPEIKDGILEAAMQMKDPHPKPRHVWRAMEKTPFKNLQNTWQDFINSLVREWKTLNIISVLLLTAILTILQIDSAAKDPLTRYAALISMICALMSLLYGCIYIIRFGTMRKSYKAVEWANEAQKTKQSIVWNIWVLLAMPATWLAWSIVLFVVCIMSFVWRTGTVEDDAVGPMTRDQVRVARIIVSLVLSLGLVYLVLMITTLRRYGEMMDHAWHRRILDWVNDTIAEKTAAAQAVPTSIPPAVTHPLQTRMLATAVGGVPAIDPNRSMPPPRSRHNLVQIETPSAELNATMAVDGATAAPSGGLETKSLPQEESSEQVLNYTKVEESENRPESSRGGIEILELYHLSTVPGDSTYIRSESTLSSIIKVWKCLTPDVWYGLEATLAHSSDAHSPEHILPVLDKFNATSSSAMGGQLALCQKFRSDESRYAICFFTFIGPLPQDHNCYDTTSIPSDCERLDIWLSGPTSAPSTSSNSGMDTTITKFSLSSKRSIDSQNAPITFPVTQPSIQSTSV